MACDVTEIVNEEDRKLSIEDGPVETNQIIKEGDTCRHVCLQLQNVTLAIESTAVDEDHDIRTNDGNPQSLDAVQNIYSKDEDGDTLLHTAIILKLTDIATCFIDLTKDSCFLNIVNNSFHTPLHLAVITNQTALIRRLLVGRADLERQDIEGNTPLHIACREGLSAIVKSLMTPISYKEVGHYTYKSSSQRIPQSLEIRNYNGQTCLHIAASNIHMEIVDILLDNSADVNARESKSGRTVCHFAIEKENHGLLERILRHPKIDVNARTYSGLLPIDLARDKGDYIGFERLVAAGALLQAEE